jgi:hypothetical protein
MTSDRLQFLQHNVNCSYEAQLSVLDSAFRNGIDILFLQEPSFPRNRSLSGDYRLCYQHPSFIPVLPQPVADLSRVPGRPRVITYIRKTLNLNWNPRYDLASDLDFQVIEFLGPEPFQALNVYNEKARDNPDQDQDPRPTFTVDRVIITRFTGPLLVTGDFNLHYEWWNPSVSGSPSSRTLQFTQWLQ